MNHPAPPTLDNEIEAMLWRERERERAAEAWEEPYDGPLETGPRIVARHRWDVAATRREELLYEWERASEQIARWQGVQVGLLAEAMDLALEDGTMRDDAPLSVRDFAAELACAVGMADRTIEQRMDDALVMRDRFPQTMAALESGRLSLPHARVVVDAGVRLADDGARAQYEALVLERSAGLTTGRLRVTAASIAEALMPTTIAERHADAREARRVTVHDVEDGMSELWALLPSVLAHGIHDRITQMARSVKDAAARGGDAGGAAPGGELADAAGGADAADGLGAAASAGSATHDARTMDQLRADALCDLALTGHPTVQAIDQDGGAGIDAIRAIVQITVPFQTLIGGDGPAPMLTGRAPVDPESARRLLGAATLWNRVLTDPVSGDVIAVDRRFPTEAQRRHLRARDEHCRFPGCRMPVWRAEIDHTVDHQHGGPTGHTNLAHLCRRHHTLKHHTPWQVEQHAGGVLEWTSPLGRRYLDRPPPGLRFVARE
ncbi:HNH endonuclease [Microbacterium sp. CFH 31415]|uniref:HNH endonuclease signature motif containing protein n=1 Tax=Microbacterium sp. CFH 31415 TaxID=2921732 RepID=UPI001F137CE2|nr:HNH endonuclease signature motif containing protein [Microbacterium sp. CFH 31415]MCH6231691.1 HNH endonuclease [Microbacterium sp. CFH 31415]